MSQLCFHRQLKYSIIDEAMLPWRHIGFNCPESSIFVGLSLEGLLDLRDAGVLLHHQEVRFTVLVQFADSAQQEARARVLVPDDSDQLSAAGHRELRTLKISPENEKIKMTLSCSLTDARGHVSRSADRHFRPSHALPLLERAPFQKRLSTRWKLFF